jgi:hypothetical protein
MKATLIAALALGAVLLFAAMNTPTQASETAPAATPLLSCPNVDGSDNNRVQVADILQVVNSFFNDAPSPDYVFLNDLDANGEQRVSDILYAVQDFFIECPRVDTEVAQATLWVAVDHPEILTEDVAALSALGYEKGSFDVPGQGIHYVNLDNWDGTFEPAAPEGLVYNNGRLDAQLYVVDGNSVGWIEDIGPNQGSCWDGVDNGGDGLTDAADGDCGSGDPPGAPPLDDIDIDPLCQTSPCSWAGDEGWHLHYRLCTTHIGTPYASAIPLGPGSDHDDCKQIQMNTSGGGYMRYAPRVGWMGHLWNWTPNPNLIEDVDGTMNGRFADCHPDGSGWKAHNCPQ